MCRWAARSFQARWRQIMLKKLRPDDAYGSCPNWGLTRKHRFTYRRKPTFVPRLEILEGRSLPSTFSVLNLADSGPGSLRDAIAAAEANPGPDQIDFGHNVKGTITLTSGQLTITSDLTINGPGADQLT